MQPPNDNNQFWQQNTSPPPPPLRMYEPPPPRRSKIPWWIILLLAVIVSLCICSSSMLYSTHNSEQSVNDINSQIQSIPTDTATSKTQNTIYKLGDVVQVDQNWNVTINSVSISQGDEFNTPKHGNEYILITMTFKNISNNQQSASTFLSMNLRGLDGMNYKQSLFYSGDQSPPDGTVLSGMSSKGVISFEVPVSVHEFNLQYQDFVCQAFEWDIKD